MNNIGKILFLITGFFIICSCSKRDINIDNPYFDSSNNSIIRISKVIANDSITQLFFDVNYIANEWIRIDSESYITDGKNKYMVTSSEGVMFNELFWMPESGHTSFTLSFPPLARGVKKFDFFESDCEDCFRISGVDLTEKRKKYILSKIPGKARKLKIIDGEIPMPDMSTGKTRLIFEIAGYNQNFDIEAISILRANEESIFPEISLDLEKGGRFSVKVPQHGPASYTLNINNFNCHFFAVPGKENHFWIDMNALINNSLLTGDSEYEYEMPIYSNNGFNDINSAEAFRCSRWSCTALRRQKWIGRCRAVVKPALRSTLRTVSAARR